MAALLLALLPLLLSAQAANAAATDGAFLVVSKAVKAKRVSENDEEITVAFSIYNSGASIAYDVSLNDATWAADVFEVIGNTTTSWDKLEGGSFLTHSFVVKPKQKGTFASPPATVTFRIASSTQQQVAHSTPLAPLALLVDEPAGSRYAWIKELVEQFGPLVSAISIVVVVVYVVLTPLGASKKALKKRR